MSRKIRSILKYTILAMLFIAVLTTIFIKREMGSIYTQDESDKKFAKQKNYDPDLHQFISPEKLISAPSETTGGNSGPLRFFLKSPYAPKSELPKVHLSKSDFSDIPSSYAVYWLGHSSAIIELDGKRILIDPVFENAGPLPIIARRFGEGPLKRENLPEIDIVLITHDHYDHLEASTIRYLSERRIRYVVPLGVGSRLQSWGVTRDSVTELGWNESFEFGDLMFTACPSMHYSGRSKNDKNRTLWASYVIKGKQKNLFWSGDTGYGSHFKEIGKKFGPFDVAFVEIDAWNNGWPKTHIFPHQSVQVVKDVNANYLFPIHLAVFDLALHEWDESIRMVYRLAEENKINIITPKMGQKVIPGVTKTDKWWELQ